MPTLTSEHEPEVSRLPLLTAIRSLEGIGTAACKPWRTEVLKRFSGIAHHLSRSYRYLADKQGYVEANQWLLSTTQKLKLGHTGLSLAGSPEELNDYCKAKARKTERQIFSVVQSVGKTRAPKLIRALVNRSGVEFPLSDDHTEDELIAAMARVCDKKWWKRALRPKQWREMEDFLRESGVTSNYREIYISNFSLNRRLEQKKKNRKLLESLEAENQDGQIYSLSELADLSPSNPIIRRSELMVRMRGFEDFAANSEDSYRALFFTLTCPSKYHASLRHGARNPKYQGGTVAEAQKYLNTVWQRIRSSLKRHNIDLYGFRVVEPHHDGTPHWHLLLFIPEPQADTAIETFRQYALAEDGDEPGAEQHRLKTVVIDPNRGSATGYIAKYVAKNIDGYQVGTDHYGRDAIQSAIRIEAWASIHGIRQFDQTGGASITVYRELRRLGDTEAPHSLVKDLMAAADSGDWQAYNRLMGGVICPRKERPLRPMMIERPQQNCYGEMVRVIKGLWYGPLAIVTRLHEWTVRLKLEDSPRNDSEDGTGYGAALSTAPPGACAPLEFCQ